ncbi:MAG: bifunctional sugar-1-phosphate nucleotidylyltransferase/acetyltransferase [Promethearchaeati archaeon SRVP18_Atabeyarchaeia-1]
MKAVILAAGEGIRLQPLSLTRPKVMLPVAGKPLLQTIIESLKSNGINDFCIVVGYLQERIRNFFGNGSRFGVELCYIEQKKAKGTADAISLAEEFVKGDDFLMSNGDVLIRKEEYGKLIEGHLNERSEVSMAVHPVGDPSQFGIAELSGDDKVTRIIEKPAHDQTDSNSANCGIYVFSSKIFDAIKRTSKSSRGEYEITQSIQQMLDYGASQVKAYRISDWWIHIGQPWDLLEANEILLRGSTEEYLVEGEVENSVSIKPPVRLGKGSIVRAGSYVEGPAVIGENSDIGPNSYIRPFTSIGDKCRIGNSCEVKNSIVMNNSRIPHLSYVGDSIIGENVNLGAGTVIANLRLDEKPIYVTVKGQRVNSGRRKLGALIGDNVRTGIGVMIMPGVTIGPDSAIAANISVNFDVPRNTFVDAEIAGSTRSWPS